MSPASIGRSMRLPQASGRSPLATAATVLGSTPGVFTLERGGGVFSTGAEVVAADGPLTSGLAIGVLAAVGAAGPPLPGTRDALSGLASATCTPMIT